MPSKLTKAFSHFTLMERLGLEPENLPRHVVYHARKTAKATGSTKRNNKEWAYKSLEVNLDYARYMHPDLPDAELAQLPINQITELLMDIIVSEHINIISNNGFKTRMVIDDAGTTILGKVSSFIPGLKTLDELNLAYLGYDKNKDDNTNINKLYQSVNDRVQLLFNIMKKSPDFKRSLLSFARVCVSLHRYDIGDLHLNNLGMDAGGNFVLFDVEHGFRSVLPGSMLEEPKEHYDYSAITQQPNKYLERIFARKPHGENIPAFKNLLGADYAIFQREVYRSLLKELMFPDSLSWSITLANTIELGFGIYRNTIYAMIFESKIALRLALLRDAEFVNYLLTKSHEDIEGICKEYFAIKKTHRNYFKDDEYLNTCYEAEVLELYIRLIKEIQNNAIYAFIKPEIDEAELSTAELEEILGTIKTSVTQCSQNRTTANKATRNAELEKAAAHFLKIVQTPEFDMQQKHFQRLVKVIMATPRLAYRKILTAFYTNNTKALGILLPRYLALKKYPGTEPLHAIDHIDEFGKSLMHYVAETSQFDAFKFLLANGATINNTKGIGRPTLLEILWNNNPAMLFFLKTAMPQKSILAHAEKYAGKTIEVWLSIYIEVMDIFTNFVKTTPQNHVSSQENYLIAVRPAFFTESVIPKRLGRKEFEKYHHSIDYHAESAGSIVQNIMEKTLKR